MCSDCGNHYASHYRRPNGCNNITWEEEAPTDCGQPKKYKKKKPCEVPAPCPPKPCGCKCCREGLVKYWYMMPHSHGYFPYVDPCLKRLCCQPEEKRGFFKSIFGRPKCAYPVGGCECSKYAKPKKKKKKKKPDPCCDPSDSEEEEYYGGASMNYHSGPSCSHGYGRGGGGGTHYDSYSSNCEKSKRQCCPQQPMNSCMERHPSPPPTLKCCAERHQSPPPRMKCYSERRPCQRPCPESRQAQIEQLIQEHMEDESCDSGESELHLYKCTPMNCDQNRAGINIYIPK